MILLSGNCCPLAVFSYGIPPRRLGGSAGAAGLGPRGGRVLLPAPGRGAIRGRRPKDGRAIRGDVGLAGGKSSLAMALAG